MGTQSVESVVGIQLLHVHLAMRHDVANEVDVAQIAYDIQLSVAPSFYVVHKAAAEVLYKLHAGSSCINTKVYIIALRRYIAGNEGLVFWTVICHSVDVNLLLLLIVAYIGVQYTQRSILKGELLDVQVSLCVRIVENAFTIALPEALPVKSTEWKLTRFRIYATSTSFRSATIESSLFGVARPSMMMCCWL